MKPCSAIHHRQSGIALLMLLAILVVAGSYAFYRSTNIGFNSNKQDTKLTIALARAKEALIAYAVIDDKRPGRMLCPDVIGDGVSPILSRDDCDGWATGKPDIYTGWLPWKTLDLAEPSDDQGTKFQYATSRFFAGDRNAPTLNSNTDTSLRLDLPVGSPSNDIVAVIIATRGALDAANSDGDEFYFTGTSKSPEDNDVITVVTRQELMAAVEKRVATELKVCIEQHAAASANTLHSYPWPAPFSSTNFRGKSGSYFGQLPATQPSAGPQAALQQSIAQIQASSNALNSATQASDQLSAIQQLGEALTQARNLYDAVYVAVTTLWQRASITAGNSATLNSEITNDLKPSQTGRISIIDSEQTRIRSDAQTMKEQIDALSSALDDSGIDAFPKQLKTRTLQFQQLSNTINAQTIQLLLTNSTTTHADIGPTLASALAASTAAVSAMKNLAQAPNDSILATAAQAATNALIDAIASLQATISSSRINRHYGEISPYASQIAALNGLLRAAPNTDNATTLAAKLGETKLLLQSIQTGASAINASRSASLLAVDQALAAAQAGIDYPLIDSTTNAAVTSINTLVSTMIINDDNLTRTSLAAAITGFKTEQASFAAINIASTSARAPYAISLQNATVDVEFWANIIAAEADSLARQAKGIPIALGEDFSKVTPLSTSAYQSTDSALTSSQNSATALQAYLNTPTTSKQTAASSALADSLAKTAAALGSASSLDASLSSSTASAFPIIWLSSRCDAFRDTADSWWNNNQWKSLVFYQISDATHTTAPGRLKVNQVGNFRVVAINAGRALGGPCPVSQCRNTRISANYFEGINADLSRDGDATTPVIDFINQAPSASFNDRLAY